VRYGASPIHLVITGFVLMAGSWLVVLLMVIGEIPPSFLLTLGAYGVSLAGLILGIFGAGQYIRGRRGSGESDEEG
jgi:hypothetical protein